MAEVGTENEAAGDKVRLDDRNGNWRQVFAHGARVVKVLADKGTGRESGLLELVVGLVGELVCKVLHDQRNLVGCLIQPENAALAGLEGAGEVGPLLGEACQTSLEVADGLVQT